MPEEYRIVVPDQIAIRLRKCSEKTGIRIEDLIMRAIIKVIEEFSG